MIISAMFMASCTTPNNTNQPKIEQIRYSMFLGKTITRFILDNGTPYKRQQLSNGNLVYSWNSKQYDFPKYNIITKEYDDDFMNSECEIRINTTAKGKIISIFALRDQAKDWDPSECRDFLK